MATVSGSGNVGLTVLPKDTSACRHLLWIYEAVISVRTLSLERWTHQPIDGRHLFSVPEVVGHVFVFPSKR